MINVMAIVVTLASSWSMYALIPTIVVQPLNSNGVLQAIDVWISPSAML